MAPENRDGGYVHLVRGTCKEFQHSEYSFFRYLLEVTCVPFEELAEGRESERERFDCVVVRAKGDNMPWVYPLRYLAGGDSDELFDELSRKVKSVTGEGLSGPFL